MKKLKLGLFEGFGIEIEYMIVDRETLSVVPIADGILKYFSGKYINELVMDENAWSNELVMHLIELKTNKPVKSINGLDKLFIADVLKINKFLETKGAILLPTAMHPLMNPEKETRIWTHKYKSIYNKYHNIFNCYNHGWANLQSIHINLPFKNDEEFGRLHAAIRLVLPLIPAIAASSPIIDGKVSGFDDTRLEVYRKNQVLVPSISGSIIPEPVYTKKLYKAEILERIYNDIKPHDPEEDLKGEWLNSRGAIARFERNAIEIRLVDVQETPKADIAISLLIISLVKSFVEEKIVSFEKQKIVSEDLLYKILIDVIKNSDQTIIEDQDFLSLFGINEKSIRAVDLWGHIFNNLIDKTIPGKYEEEIKFILKAGTLSRRIKRHLGADFTAENIREVYKKLSSNLYSGELFE